jgi:hypothetical protein
LSNGIVSRSNKVKEGLKFDTSWEELLDQLKPILPNTITQELYVDVSDDEYEGEED